MRGLFAGLDARVGEGVRDGKDGREVSSGEEREFEELGRILVPFGASGLPEDIARL